VEGGGLAIGIGIEERTDRYWQKSTAILLNAPDTDTDADTDEEQSIRSTRTLEVHVSSYGA
jgi:hypothetical protein